ncbi:non-hydrolyzing UDP-N-acetylglucosamine 2-epimerase [Halobacterium litoreum]|uniref:Non-hydrolyzing UDP-N-acetylglucosamine 2-epimerase n=1 Tax=Halobacterium litoreum TaxID=2039234 RepID=A0ABD5N842_9EURY|nr:UDP-N-acetylglucosamine 2-epimerase (non-hydrolyzing) [Halobacterium litoreum]UHH12131.1 UDP-N-acetylglucosamine 2-epimerase (non-hydrolyzing) [Halobacterium litoreum]
MTVCSVVGVRPEFVLATPLSRALADRGVSHALVHTGQHHDDALSAVFFEELSLPAPDHHLGVGSAPRGEQVARAVARLRPILAAESPDVVVVYGDTTSTLAGALAAVAADCPLAHVEAGLRSGDWTMSEERTRVVVDHLADARFAPTQTAVANLADEGVTESVHRTGDLRADAVETARGLPAETPDTPDEYVLATVHRAATTDDEATLVGVLDALARVSLPVVLPLHPRTEDRLRAYGCYDWAADRVSLVDPTGYPAFLDLLAGASAVATDSGGVQREAAYLGTPCVTLRETTEWVETVARGQNVLAGTRPAAVTNAVEAAVAATPGDSRPPTGAADEVARTLADWATDEPAARPLPDRA